MLLRRRVFLASAAGSVFAAPSAPRFQVGTMDGVLRMQGKPESVEVASKLGLASVQVTLGRSSDGRTLPLEDPSVQSAWRAASRKYSIPLTSTYIDMLHADCLKDNPNAPMWVRKGIDITKQLG